MTRKGLNTPSTMTRQGATDLQTGSPGWWFLTSDPDQGPEVLDPGLPRFEHLKWHISGLKRGDSTPQIPHFGPLLEGPGGVLGGSTRPRAPLETSKGSQRGIMDYRRSLSGPSGGSTNRVSQQGSQKDPFGPLRYPILDPFWRVLEGYSRPRAPLETSKGSHCA